MAVISLIVTESILFVVLLFTISITVKDKSISKNDEGLNRFLVFAYAYIIGLCAYIVQYMLSGTKTILIYFCSLITWYAYCAILASMINQSIYVFANKRMWIRRVTEILCYYSLLVVIAELVAEDFVYESNITGLEFKPGLVPMGIFYATPIVIYYICMGYLLWDYHKTHIKPREKHLMKIALGATIPSFFGLIAETVCHTVFNVRYPVFFVLLIIPFKLMSDLHLKNRSFMLLEEDFDSILKTDNTDAIFVCDDELVILYQNKGALINSQLFRDTYVGRKLTDVFVLDADVKRALKSKEARDGLMVPAIYPLTERKLVMSVEYIYDCVDEILCSIITIPNYEVSMDEKSFMPEEDEAVRVGNDLDIASKVPGVLEKPEDLSAVNKFINKDVNVLIVDEDQENLDLYTSLLEQYDIKITRANGGRIAIDMMLDPCYDAVFIYLEMEKLNGIETAKRIRGLGNEYYSEVPIIFILSEPVANVYKDLLDVKFNDFIEMPLSAGNLNPILSRWLWRRYAITDNMTPGIGSSRTVRSVNALEDMYSDCKQFCDNGKMSYIGYTLKGMKRLCSKLEYKDLTDACDNMTDAYIRGLYSDIPEMLEEFHNKLEQFRSSRNFGMVY